MIYVGDILPFKSREDIEIEALRSEVESLRQELQSLSENVTGIMQMVYKSLEDGLRYRRE